MDEQSDEWEYEYDLHETEHLYLTLDLTTHVPEAIAAHQVLRNGKRATKEVVSRPTDNGAPGLGDSNSAQQPAGSLQFLDLDTTEPLVRFNEGIYSCNWHTDLGTQFFVTQPGSISKPVRPGHVLDVVGTSQTRLLGRPVKLHQRKDWADDTPRDSPRKPADGPGFDSGRMLAATLPPSELSNLRPGQQLVVPLDAIKKPEQAAQASFLEKLSAIKLQKGEHDIIPVAGVKHYPPPANKDEIRQRALATAAAAQKIMPADPPPSMPPAGKRRRITFAEMGLETKAAKKRRLKQEALAGKVPVTQSSPAASTLTTPVSGRVHSAASSRPTSSRPTSSQPTSSRPTSSTVQYDLPSTYADPPEGSTAVIGYQTGSALPWTDLPPMGTSAEPRPDETSMAGVRTSLSEPRATAAGSSAIVRRASVATSRPPPS